MAKDREEADWLEARGKLVEAVRGGLMTRAEVMAELGVSASVLAGWCRTEQRRRVKPRAPTGRSALRRVTLVGPEARAAVADVVLRGGRRVRVAAGFDAAEVRRLVEALESC